MRESFPKRSVVTWPIAIGIAGVACIERAALSPPEPCQFQPRSFARGRLEKAAGPKSEPCGYVPNPPPLPSRPDLEPRVALQRSGRYGHRHEARSRAVWDNGRDQGLGVHFERGRGAVEANAGRAGQVGPENLDNFS